MTAAAHLLGRAGALLRAISQREPAGGTTTELARATGLARPTAHRLLTSLTQEGLVDRDRTSGRWLLGPELYLLGAAASARYDVTALARPAVRRLAQATGESAFFSVRRGEETVCLVREDGSFPIRSFVLYEGVRFPLGVASAGLAILAYLEDRDVQSYLARADLTTAHGPEHSVQAVGARVAATRKTGYAVNPGLIVAGSWGMAAAVFGPDGEPAGALSLTGIESRFGPDRQPELGRLLLHEAHELTLGLQGPPRGRGATPAPPLDGGA